MEKLRLQIEKVDHQILRLLNKRAELGKKVAFVKNRGKLPVFDPARESKLLRKLKNDPKNIIPKDAIERIFLEIISVCRALNRPLTVAYLGPEASFTNEAAVKRFGSMCNYVPCMNISDVFLSVEKGQCDYGVVPVENSIEGAVTYTLDMFVDTDLKICAQIVMEISHNIIGRVSLSKVRRIYSHPIVFGQCRNWLEANMPSVELVGVASTAYAAKLASEDKESAAIGSLLAARKYKLNVLAEQIEDYPHNFTRFFVIGGKISPPSGKDRTSIVFSVKDEVGALHHMLLPFKKAGINLTKIESRPSKKKLWDYYFFVDLDGHVEDENVKKALSEVEKKCKFFKILGAYPVD